MSYRKTKIAAEMTLDWYTEEAKKHGERLRLWTFTLPDVCDAYEFRARWHELRKALVSKLGFHGIRAFEVHPGGHGYHVHIVTSGYFRAEAVRAVAEQHGFGRIHVCVCFKPEYILKYMTKKGRKYLVKGVKLWDCLGKIARAVRVSACNLVETGGLADAYAHCDDDVCTAVLGDLYARSVGYVRHRLRCKVAQAEYYYGAACLHYLIP